MKFILTKDQETKEQLLSLGYHLISEQGGIATFLNDTSKNFTFDRNKATYSNKLNF